MAAVWEETQYLDYLENNIACKDAHLSPRKKIKVFYYFREKPDLLAIIKILE